MSKHTKGPWILSSSKTEVLYIQNPHPFNLVATCDYGRKEDGTGKYGHTMEEAEANARLIAAAPELLEELKRCCILINKTLIEETFDPNTDNFGDLSIRLQKLQLIIKKAEGDKS